MPNGIVRRKSALSAAIHGDYRKTRHSPFKLAAVTAATAGKAVKLEQNGHFFLCVGSHHSAVDGRTVFRDKIKAVYNCAFAFNAGVTQSVLGFKRF